MMLKRIFALSVLAMGLTACASAPYDHQYDYYNGPDYLYPPGVLPPPPPEHGHKPPPPEQGHKPPPEQGHKPPPPEQGHKPPPPEQGHKPPPPEQGHKPPPAVRPPMGGAHPPMVSPGAIRPMPRR